MHKKIGPSLLVCLARCATSFLSNQYYKGQTNELKQLLAKKNEVLVDNDGKKLVGFIISGGNINKPIAPKQ